MVSGKEITLLRRVLGLTAYQKQKLLTTIVSIIGKKKNAYKTLTKAARELLVAPFFYVQHINVCISKASKP